MRVLVQARVHHSQCTRAFSEERYAGKELSAVVVNNAGNSYCRNVCLYWKPLAKDTMYHKLFLQNFCCCISLKNGCIAIGALEWAYTVYLSCRYNELKKVGCTSLKISCMQIYYNVVSFVVSAAIVSGITKKCRAYFIPWLIIKIIEYIYYTAIMIYDLQARYTLTVDILLPLTFVLVTIFVFWYSWLCVLSLYFNMGHSDDKAADQNNHQIQDMV
ncbi:hypothetical protein CBL_01169 [Carabus blaptoides fortunei]